MMVMGGVMMGGVMIKCCVMLKCYAMIKWRVMIKRRVMIKCFAMRGVMMNCYEHSSSFALCVCQWQAPRAPHAIVQWRAEG